MSTEACLILSNAALIFPFLKLFTAFNISLLRGWMEFKQGIKADVDGIPLKFFSKLNRLDNFWIC